jgi:phospholipid-binding lipoprotein MlaA
MKASSCLFVVAVVLAAGCVHNQSSVVPPSPSAASVQPPPVIVATNSEQIPLKPEVMLATSGQSDPSDETSLDYVEEGEERAPTVTDPLEPFNRAMFHFNDKLYFWVLKPVARGYNEVMPEGARISVRNFFSNVVFPIRFVNCLLQGNFNGAAIELSRFTVNTLLGLGGLFDPASSPEMKLMKQEADFGQTLGVYGLGQGIFLTWPIFGPSTPRDTVGLAGDWFVNPITYLPPWYVPYALKSYDRVNEVSLRIGDYEALKEAAIDPYLALRDAYLQYRQKKVEAARARSLGGKAEPPPGPP